MTKSTITREQLEEWVAQFDEDGGCDATDRQLEALIRQSLAAMYSETVEMPLDYLQGHKDGLEWAARLAEANHPDTGDWLYDDPIELAKAIRKGPDMPPAQPAADSEPVAWTWHYREQWYVTNDKCRAEFVAKDGDVAVLPLYRHAHPAPVVPDEVEHVAAVLELIGSFEAADIDSDTVDLRFEIDDVDTGSDASITEYAARGAAIIRMLAGNSPAIPDGYVMVPKDVSPEQLRAFQLKTKIGAYVTANWSDAYDSLRELWDEVIAHHY